MPERHTRQLHSSRLANARNASEQSSAAPCLLQRQPRVVFPERQVGLRHVLRLHGAAPDGRQPPVLPPVLRHRLLQDGLHGRAEELGLAALHGVEGRVEDACGAERADGGDS